VTLHAKHAKVVHNITSGDGYRMDDEVWSAKGTGTVRHLDTLKPVVTEFNPCIARRCFTYVSGTAPVLSSYVARAKAGGSFVCGG
jgi:hypothetical protein